MKSARARTTSTSMVSNDSFMIPFISHFLLAILMLTSKSGLSRAAILSAVEQSLERLQTSYIDVLHIHRWDPLTPIEETMSTLHGLVCAGKVRYLAASSMWAFQLAQLQHVAAQNGWTGMVAIQCHYNLIYREEEREMLKFCKTAGIGVLSVQTANPLIPRTVA